MVIDEISYGDNQAIGNGIEDRSCCIVQAI